MKTNYFWIAVIVFEFALAIVGLATRNTEAARHSVTMAVLYMAVTLLTDSGLLAPTAARRWIRRKNDRRRTLYSLQGHRHLRS